MRSNGTYVPGHFRSAPDGVNSNNWSARGNVNPYTGKSGMLNPYAPNTGRSYGSTYASSYGSPYVPAPVVAPNSAPAYGTGYSPGYGSGYAAPPAYRYAPYAIVPSAPAGDTYRPNVMPSGGGWASPGYAQPATPGVGALDPTYPSAAAPVPPPVQVAPQPLSAPVRAEILAGGVARCPWGHKPYELPTGAICVPRIAPEYGRLTADSEDFECLETHRRYGARCVPGIDTQSASPTN